MKALHGLALVLLAIGAAAVSSPPAHPQSGTTVTISERGRQCLCLKQRIDRARRETDLQAGMLEERDSEFAAVTQELNTLRATINPQDLAAVESFKRLLEHQQALRNFIQRELRPTLTAGLSALNDDIAVFNGQCVGATPKTVPPNLECSDFPDHHMKSR
jgi:hypothetical protein